MPPQGDTTNAKQLIVERIRQSTNILVAVNANPSVDSLAAALALSLMLNKLDKHATAVFSGQVPAFMQFLQPQDTFESNVDSLRDFIISLDKEKADRLRYKLENDVVRIFITPYRTTITEKDLQFSQGDFNVDLIIALGVEKRDDLDKAIVAHGRILHDATVVTINANNQQSSLGAVDWHDPNASSLCEMLMSLSEALQKPGLLDGQIATSLLTGIVAATERFSNQHTTPRVMTMSAQLMAAGANQQLVASNMQQAHQPLPQVSEPDKAAAAKDGELDITHKEKPKKSKPSQDPDAALKEAEEELAKALPAASEPAPQATADDLKTQLLEDAAQKTETPATSRKFVTSAPATDAAASLLGGDEPQAEAAITASPSTGTESWRGRRIEPPSLGGSLSATAEEALEDTLKAEQEKRNHTLLSHDGTEEPADARQEPMAEPQPPKPAEEPLAPNEPAQLPGAELTLPEPPAPVPVEPTAQTAPLPPLPELPAAPAVDPALTTEPAPTLTPATPPAAEPPVLDIESALQAANAAYANQPFSPAGNPTQAVAATPLPSTDEQSYIPLQPPASVAPQVPAAPSAPTEPPVTQSTPPPTSIGGLPVIPPMPALPVHEPGSLAPPMPPPLPPLPGEPATPPDPNAPTGTPQPPVDPTQFKIPGA